jgi:hypothetical protein
MTTHSLIFKSTLYYEWYVSPFCLPLPYSPNNRFSDRIMPWVHYVPIQLVCPCCILFLLIDLTTSTQDYSDLYDALAFFHGYPDTSHGHEYLAERIAHAGREWSKKYFRKEDMTAYMFR